MKAKLIELATNINHLYDFLNRRQKILVIDKYGHNFGQQFLIEKVITYKERENILVYVATDGSEDSVPFSICQGGNRLVFKGSNTGDTQVEVRQKS